MINLSADFQQENIIHVDLKVPLLAIQALRRIFEITSAKDICIAGGFVRGLYMQQVLGLSPQMNDIDVFADIQHEEFESIENHLKAAFGKPIRFHIGRFEKEENPRGLLEFSIPKQFRENCAGVESIQLNFGMAHPWANAYKYTKQANVGMNQIAIHSDGKIFASPLFINDMNNKTMTMNQDRDWTLHDWLRTSKSLERRQTERPEFYGWKSVLTQKPYVPDTGFFWDIQESLFQKPSI